MATMVLTASSYGADCQQLLLAACCRGLVAEPSAALQDYEEVGAESAEGEGEEEGEEY